MNKLFITVLVVLAFLGCQKSYWNQTDQITFNQDCREAGYTKISCDCVVLCLQNEYLNYEAALNKILSEELSEELNLCIQKCNDNY